MQKKKKRRKKGYLKREEREHTRIKKGARAVGPVQRNLEWKLRCASTAALVISILLLLLLLFILLLLLFLLLSALFKLPPGGFEAQPSSPLLHAVVNPVSLLRGEKKTFSLSIREERRWMRRPAPFAPSSGQERYDMRAGGEGGSPGARQRTKLSGCYPRSKYILYINVFYCFTMNVKVMLRLLKSSLVARRRGWMRSALRC